MLLTLVVGYGWLEFTEPSRNPGLESGNSEVLKASTTQSSTSFQSGDVYYIDETVPAGIDGCNLAFTRVELGPYFTDNLLKSVFIELLSTTESSRPNTFSALSDSDLTFIASRVVDGVVAVELRGWLRVEDACQQQQAVEQLERTIERIAGTDEIEIFINQRPLMQTLRFEERY